MAYRAMEGSTPNLASPSLGAELGFATIYQSIRLTRVECQILIDQYVRVVELLDQRIRVEKTEERHNEANEVRLDRASHTVTLNNPTLLYSEGEHCQCFMKLTLTLQGLFIQNEIYYG